MYEGVLGEALTVYCMSHNFKFLVDCYLEGVNGTASKNCSDGYRPYKTGQQFVFNPLREEDIGMYECGSLDDNNRTLRYATIPFWINGSGKLALSRS